MHRPRRPFARALAVPATLAALAALVLVAALAACTARPPDRGAAGSGGAGPRAVDEHGGRAMLGRPAVPGTPQAPDPGFREPSDPSQWTLPLLAYRPGEEQRRTLVGAEQTLVRSCMRRYGFDWAPSEEIPAPGPRNAMDWRYGIHDARLAATRGYQPDQAQQEQYDRARRAVAARPPLSAEGRAVLTGGTGAGPHRGKGPAVRAPVRAVPPGGCLGEARSRLGTASHGSSPLVEGLLADALRQAAREPAVRAVFRLWSQCMRTSGYRYADPLALAADPRFARTPHPVGAVETGTALADLRCRGRLRVTEVWYGAEVRVQERAVAAHAAELAAVREGLDEVFRNATEVVAQSRAFMEIKAPAIG
ncbi:hypothetical protein [Streptomyces sp. NPDC089919]|uniref:hypothetical protein n=1 Tax=Streptomyces sp. NPDC089919 TaxID=3155188 RepID=UPI00343D6816